MKRRGTSRRLQLIMGGRAIGLSVIAAAVLVFGLDITPAARADTAGLQSAAVLQNSAATAAAGAAAQREVPASATRRHLLLFAGGLETLALAALAAFLRISRARHQRAARAAREQTDDVLQTMQEGFFLLDANHRIGAVWSAALTRMFAREDFAGLAFEELLQGLVPPATLAAATEYIKLLWGKSAQENLANSINPLVEFAIRVDNGRGGRDTRYLQFDFHRVMHEGRVKHVVVSANDVSSKVFLARELSDARRDADSHIDMLLGVMHIDPLQLAAFLDASEAAMQLVNVILKQPARSDGEFRMKLDRLLHELHGIKGEATALNFTSVARRAQAFEDLVTELKERPQLSGVDFLPLVLKLDELLAHLRSIRALDVRVAALRVGALADALPPHAQPTRADRATLPADDLAASLQTLAEHLGRDLQKQFRLSLNDLTQIPPCYRTTVRDVLIQMLRNSAVHGIEPADVRRAHGKNEVGLVRAEFRANADGCELVFEDDGAGLAIDALKTAAIRKRLTTAAEAARMDTRSAMGLIFRPGVSTCARPTMDAGRGVGMDVVARAIAALGGKIVLSTDAGKFTRFKIALPANQTTTSAAVA